MMVMAHIPNSGKAKAQIPLREKYFIPLDPKGGKQVLQQAEL